jgi:hypothetical protein
MLERLTHGMPQVNHEVNSNVRLVQLALNDNFIKLNLPKPLDLDKVLDGRFWTVVSLLVVAPQFKMLMCGVAGHVKQRHWVYCCC